MAMIDHWKSATNYSGYYHACEPVQCTFMIVRKNSVVYSIVLLLGLYGGLTVALRIIAPWIVRCRHVSMCQSEETSRSSLPTQAGTVTHTLTLRIKSILSRVRESILSFNLFAVSWRLLMMQGIG